MYRRQHRARILEGGAAGHLQHPWENLELTFSDLKEILELSSSGELKKVTEKLDGQNLVVTWNEERGALQAARNGGNIKSGGMLASDLAEKFQGRGAIYDAFTTSFSILESAIASLSPTERIAIFGEQGDYWYSLEIIYAPTANVVDYDKDSLVFHESPIFHRLPSGEVELATERGIEALLSSLDRMQEVAARREWNLRGPAFVNLRRMSDPSKLNEALASLDQLMSTYQLSDTNTIGDYITRRVWNDEISHIRGLEENEKVQMEVARKIAGYEDALSFNELKKMISDKSTIEDIRNLLKRGPEIVKSYTQPLETLITKFAMEFLKEIDSVLIAGSSEATERLRAKVENAIQQIRAGGGEGALATLEKQLARLGSLENITSPLEGVVFIYKGQPYKFTGSFAAVNQIVGILKYGRGSSPNVEA